MPNWKTQPDPLTDSQRMWALLGVGLGVFMSTLDVGIINVALPTLVQTLKTSFPTAQWAVLGYQLVSSSLVLGATRLGDIWGKKSLYLGGMILFTLSSLLCGLAQQVMTSKLTGKVAIITGASSGIGEATAIALAAEGAKVAIAARRYERLEALAKHIETSGGKALPILTDITDETQVRNLVQKTHSELGRVDILVNNAGIALTGNIDGGNPSDWRRMVDLNVLGLLYATHAVLPLLKAQKSGHIVNVSSVAGRTARAGVGVYNATKWGVNAISESLRLEVYKDNIRVTIVEPGLVATEINNYITDPVAKQVSAERRKTITPLQSEDIANAIAYAVTQPPHVNVNEILIRPIEQER